MARLNRKQKSLLCTDALQFSTGPRTLAKESWLTVDYGYQGGSGLQTRTNHYITQERAYFLMIQFETAVAAAVVATGLCVCLCACLAV